MAAHRVRNPFDISKPLVVTRQFRCGGRLYRAGEPFDWRGCGASARQARLIWQSRNVEVAGPLEGGKVGEPARPLRQAALQAAAAARQAERVDASHRKPKGVRAP